MSEPVALRDYQVACVDNVFAYINNGGRRGLCVMPTGSGKSLCVASIAAKGVSMGARVLVVTHVQELVEQDREALLRYDASVSSGVYSAGLGRKETSNSVIFASVQSLAKNPAVLGDRHLVIVDEAHMVPAKTDTSYGKLLLGLRELVPDLVILGMSATPYRLQSGMLTEPWRDHAPIFDDIIFDLPVKFLIENGTLSPMVAKAPKASFDLGGVSKIAGDFNQGELEAAVDVTDVNELVCAEIAAAMKTRTTMLLFAVGVEHARHLHSILTEKYGLKLALVLGDLGKPERAEIMRGLKSGELQGACNVNVLTVGFDCPSIDLICSVRPTMSAALHVQMLGRGLRRSPDKASCLLLDFAQNVSRHGPLDTITGRKDKKGGTGQAPCKVCPGCNSIVHASVHFCPDCRYEFPQPDRLKGIVADGAAEAPISDIEADWVRVHSAWALSHNKVGKPPTLRLVFKLAGKPKGSDTTSAFFSFDQAANPWARKKSHMFWQLAAGTVPPGSSLEAVERCPELRVPGQLLVARDGVYTRIEQYDFDVPAEDGSSNFGKIEQYAQDIVW